MVMNNQDWLLKRNCSLSPRQLALVYIALCMTSFIVAVLFTLNGAWYVLAFALLEMAAVALAFLHFARHATDHEHIALRDGCVLVERVEGGRHQEIKLDAYWTHVGLPRAPQDLITLQARGISIDVGRFATQAKRRQVAHELRHQLHQQMQNGTVPPAASCT
jgi:uncharacterized membrane protein